MFTCNTENAMQYDLLKAFWFHNARRGKRLYISDAVANEINVRIDQAAPHLEERTEAMERPNPFDGTQDVGQSV